MFIIALFICLSTAIAYPTVDVSPCGSECNRLPSYLSVECTKCLWEKGAMPKFSFDEFATMVEDESRSSDRHREVDLLHLLGDRTLG